MLRSFKLISSGLATISILYSAAIFGFALTESVALFILFMSF